MYLTSFYVKHEKEIYQSLYKTLSNYKYDCVLQSNPRLNPGAPSNTYALWDTNLPACLQNLSDRIVNATYPYIDENAKKQEPEWIEHLPEPTRSLKKKMIKEFGSPNVFSQFTPHITVGHDDVTPDVFNALLAGPVADANKCVVRIRQVSVGSVGKYGTVNRGKDKWTYKFNF
ncbi:valS [Acrasis kona]